MDNDGDLDLFVVNWYNDNNLLFLNNGEGGFTQVVSGDPVLDGGLSETASWGDYDNDGFLDLVVTNSGSGGVARRNFLYHNRNGSLARVIGNAVSDDVEFSRGATWIDYDNDGDIDLFVVNEEQQNNSLYRNMLKETGVADFEKCKESPLVSSGGSSWSASWGDYNNDGYEDVLITNWGGEDNFLFKNTGDGTFVRVIDDTIAHDGGYSASSGWGDYDNDGDLDMIVTSAYRKGEKLTNVLYQNFLMETGRPAFGRREAGPVTADSGYSYGVAWGDYDNDGNLDLFVARTFNEAQTNVLYRNDGTTNHWLGLRCEGTRSNRAALGTTVRARAAIGGKAAWQMRRVSGQNGYCNQNLLLNFGLGDATVVDSLVVEWPSGVRSVYRDLAVDRYLDLSEDGPSTAREGSRK
jgi:enediyne biosynthesis protein E4